MLTPENIEPFLASQLFVIAALDSILSSNSLNEPALQAAYLAINTAKASVDQVADTPELQAKCQTILQSFEVITNG